MAADLKPKILAVALWVVVGVLLTAAAPKKAPPDMFGFVDAAELSQFCAETDPLGLERRMVCLSYITGAVDQILAQQALDDSAYRTICLPSDVTAEAVMREVNAYANWSKTAKGVSGANFVRFAMESAYPCDADDTEAM